MGICGKNFRIYCWKNCKRKKAGKIAGQLILGKIAREKSRKNCGKNSKKIAGKTPGKIARKTLGKIAGKIPGKIAGNILGKIA